MSGVLQRILQSKETDIGALRNICLPPPAKLRPVRLKRAPGEPIHLLAEIKRKSPSAGELSAKLSVASRSAIYARGGASLISILTDNPFFGGSFEDLASARAACSLPLLCKDFILDEVQLDAARAWGADAALLIVRCLDSVKLQKLVKAAQLRGLVPLVEVTTEYEAEVALSAGATVIGVNARDLDTLRMDAGRAARVLSELPPTITALHLSGVVGPSDVRVLARSRADGALVGEALMRLDNPEALLRSLVQAGTVD